MDTAKRSVLHTASTVKMKCGCVVVGCARKGKTPERKNVSLRS